MSVLIDRIRGRLDALGLRPATAAKAAGLHPDYLRNILDGKSLSPRADKLAQLARVLHCDLPFLLGEGAPPAPPLPTAGFDRATPAYMPLREEPAAFGHADSPGGIQDQMPIYGSADGGEFGMTVTLTPIEFMRRPEPLARVPGAFGLYMVGTTMAPKYQPGDLLLIHPTRPAAPQDHVLAVRAVTSGPADAMIGCHLGRDDEGAILLGRYAPGLAPIALPRSEGVWRVQVIVGSYDARR